MSPDQTALLNCLTRRVVAARLQLDALLREEKLLGEALTRLRTGESVLVVEARLLSYGLEL